ncbi:glycosyl transferase family 1, partial [Capnocytophaga sp.]
MKKVLIITYYWTPAGGPGVQRWLKFVKYLRDFNIEPIVYIPENPTYPIIDNEIGNDLPTDIQIIKHPIWEPYAWASLFSKKKTKKISSGIIPRKKVSILDKVLLWIRGNCFIPDARKFWVKPSVKYLNKFIKENQIETIITTSPPHSVHLIGYELKKLIPHLKWISDFRDPWTTIGYYKDLRLTKWADKCQHYWEKEVLQQSDLVITTSFKTQKDFQQLTNTPIEVITNGYDEEKTITPPLSNKFLISYIGSLLSDRNPKMLWEVLEELLIEEEGFKDDFQL